MNKKRKTRAESRARYFIREQAKIKGWNINHIERGGDCLEEQEIIAYFPDIGLGLNKPDFIFCLQGEPVLVIEAKNEADKLNNAIKEAIDYANLINQNSSYSIKFAVGAAGEEDKGFSVTTKYYSSNKWTSLMAYGNPLTAIPSKREIELALEANNGTTYISIPSLSEFIDVAIELSRILRTAKVEAPLRPKVVGSIILAMYQGEINFSTEKTLLSINELISSAINSSIDIESKKKKKLIDSLSLSGADFDRLTPYIRRITTLLKSLNIRSVLKTDTDFLGIFYEAFLRYGYDNNALGIVFTPRHITRFCVELLDVNPKDKVIDVACGTGGFLVSAYDKMMDLAKDKGNKIVSKIKNSLYGFDTNPTVWALATLNMFFRGDGKSHIELDNCFNNEAFNSVISLCTKAFLNPPFSQIDEPETDFIDRSLQSLEPEGYLAVIVIAGIFSDANHVNWRKRITKEHTVLAVISLPDDLFYPVASAPTSILVIKAHIPQSDTQNVLMAKIWNDGYEKLKNKRIEVDGEQLTEIKEIFQTAVAQEECKSDIATMVLGKKIKNGQEWSPQEWLPSPNLSFEHLEKLQNDILKSIFKAVTYFPELADMVIDDFIESWQHQEDLPVNKVEKLSYFFHVENGKSVGEKHYRDGSCPYISSGENFNSIIRLVEEDNFECFFDGGITVTAFGQAYIQPWCFMARGNGGSSVRVLIPKFNMSFRELIWFTTQINSQQWRIFYARMAIKSRIERLIVQSPYERLMDCQESIGSRIRLFRDNFDNLTRLH